MPPSIKEMVKKNKEYRPKKNTNLFWREKIRHFRKILFRNPPEA